jgi:hypothetical protein
MNFKKISIYVTIVTLIACVSKKVLGPTQSDVDRVKDKFPGYTLTELNHGKTLYEQNCASCHILKNPSSETEEEWKKIVPEMVLKVNRKTTVLSAKDQDDILKYLITMGSAMPK